MRAVSLTTKTRPFPHDNDAEILHRCRGEMDSWCVVIVSSRGPHSVLSARKPPSHPQKSPQRTPGLPSSPWLRWTDLRPEWTTGCTRSTKCGIVGAGQHGPRGEGPRGGSGRVSGLLLCREQLEVMGVESALVNVKIEAFGQTQSD